MGAPALLDAQALAAMERINGLVTWTANHITGGVVTDGGMTQASGANATLNFDVDVAAVDALVSNVPRVIAAGVDVDPTAGDAVLWGATSGKSVIFALVLTFGTDGVTTPAYDAIPGAVATTGSQVAPTEAQIGTAVGHDNWAFVADVTYNRTADTTLTAAFSYARRASIGYKVSPTGVGPSLGEPLSTDETTWRTGA